MILKVLRFPLVSGLLGGGVVAAVLVLTGVVDNNPSKTTTIVRQAPISSPAASGTPNQGLTANSIYQEDGPGVVKITATIVQRSSDPLGLFPQVQRGTATGSGFVIDKQGRILTNAHVVTGASKIDVQFGKGNVVPGKIVGQDRSTDLALIQVDPSRVNGGLHPLELGTTKNVHVGDPVVALGNPFGLDRSLTEGVVSAIQRQIRSPNGFTIDHVIQTDAAINPGNSGGPLIDAAGRVIGINSQIETDGSGEGNVGIGFAIPIDTAKRVLPQLKSNGHVERSFLGIEGTSINDSLKGLGLAAQSGVLVEKVLPRSPAAKAGLQGGTSQVQVGSETVLLGGDVIQSLDDQKIATWDQLVSALSKRKPGDTVELGILRDGHERTVKVTLTQQPASATTR